MHLGWSDLELPGEPPDVEDGGRFPAARRDPPQAATQNPDAANPQHEGQESLVRPGEAHSHVAQHPEDDVDVVLHHHHERIAPDDEQVGVLDDLGAGGARRPAEQ